MRGFWILFGFLVLAVVLRAPMQIGARSTSAAQRPLAAALVETAVSMADGQRTLLRPEYVRGQLAGWEADPGLRHAVRAAVSALGPRRTDVPADDQVSAAVPVIRLLEKRFILDPTKSSLDLLPPEQRDRFEKFPWNKDDFPGGPVGPNEAVADEMVNALRAVRPERRANSTENAVARRDEIEKTGWQWVLDMEQPIPGQSGQKLNREALASFIRMRDDARKDGVTLFSVSSSRDPIAAARNAARTGNPNAVASFSSHSLGLAVDFRMSDGRQNFDEVSTGDMPGLVRMRRSAVHKWLFLRGYRYGWYPYMQEPWHWEYNPVGFRQTFWALMGGPPGKDAGS